MTDALLELAAEGIALRFDPATGQIRDLAVTRDAARAAPYHMAPWVGTGEAMPEGAPPHFATLGGDFFCAPFASRDGGSPPHGWSANSSWTVVSRSVGQVSARLDRTVCGATLTKEITLRDGHPFVYQRHVFTGGTGPLPVANHANIALPRGGLIRCSPKAAWETPADPQEGDPSRGRSALAYPSRSADPRAFPGSAGPVDLTRYPWGDRHEDFVAGIEAPGHRLGWTAVTRAEGDLYLSLRDPDILPMTMLWHSNGGRDYAPWSGRHFGCLGVEEGAAAGLLGLSGEEALRGAGAVRLGGTVELRHVTGALPWPGDEGLAAVKEIDGGLLLRGEAGTEREVPWDRGFLFGEG